MAKSRDRNDDNKMKKTNDVAYVKPIGLGMNVKKEPTCSKKMDELNEEKKQLIVDLIAAQSRVQRSHFDLQKGELALKKITLESQAKDKHLSSLQLEVTTLLKALDSKEQDMRADQNANLKIVSDLTEELKFVKSKLSNCEKQLEIEKTTSRNNKDIISKLRTSEKNLSARMKQFQCGSTSPTSRRVTEEDIYDIDELLGHRTKYRKRQFLVKWKGFESRHNSWEPEANLKCPELLNEYLQSHGLK